jgi:hypothetical protein
LNKLILENLISSLKSLENELVEDEPSKESKFISLTPKEKSAKALQASESEEETPNGGSEVCWRNGLFNQKISVLDQEQEFPKRSSVSKGPGFKNRREDHYGCLNCKKPGHFIADWLELQKGKSKKEISK